MLLEEINLSTVYSFRNTSGLSAKNEGIGTKVGNTHMKFCGCSRRIQVYLSATDTRDNPPQTNPDNQKYAIVSLPPESFIKRKYH